MKSQLSSRQPKRRKYLPIGLYRVSGTSMEPTYQAGDLLIGVRWFRPQVGWTVIAYLDRPVVKRLKKITSEGYWLEGDNIAHSTDSRQLGVVTRRQIEAKVIYKF